MRPPDSHIDPPQPGPARTGRQVFHEVEVGPYSDLLDAANGGHDHRGGPVWPDWENRYEARHRRYGAPVDERPLPAEIEDRLDGPLSWGGPIDRHFGHQIADFSMRLVSTLADAPESMVAFAAHPRWGWASMDETPQFARDILDWLGVAKDKRLLVTRPSLVRELSVWPQAEQHHGPGPGAAHLDRMDALVASRLPERLPRSGVLYVSRAKMHARLAGEGYLERAMIRAGARVIRPETVPLVDQLRAYVAAEVAIFAEGSAVQSSRLLGRNLGRVIVVQRRPGDRIAEDALGPRADAVSYLDALAGVVCGLNHADEPFEVLGLPIIDPERLIEELRDALPSLSRLWDLAAYREARDDDVLAWLDRSLRSPRVAGERSWRYILDTLARCGLSHLVNAAAAMMAERERPGAPAGS